MKIPNQRKKQNKPLSIVDLPFVDSTEEEMALVKGGLVLLFANPFSVKAGQNEEDVVIGTIRTTFNF